jgi:hypothetical protein
MNGKDNGDMKKHHCKRRGEVYFEREFEYGTDHNVMFKWGKEIEEWVESKFEGLCEEGCRDESVSSIIDLMINLDTK